MNFLRRGRIQKKEKSAGARAPAPVGATSSLRDFQPLAEARAGRAEKRGRPEAASLDCGEMTTRS